MERKRLEAKNRKTKETGWKAREREVGPEKLI